MGYVFIDTPEGVVCGCSLTLLFDISAYGYELTFGFCGVTRVGMAWRIWLLSGDVWTWEAV